ncbi:hypothetical protein LMG28614_06534 [Paraburkholderia ultramafica]|uniref:Carboxymuconolactone decarboxylase-like domain-containing protein n=1 Tax=Paraburkholderia ultramafica TaxID=1544867 RepID=A0A6S7D5C7_9BURK|nr:hypothetical protein LMG28614_06534 [Paraburkholderia ultramafica]
MRKLAYASLFVALTWAAQADSFGTENARLPPVADQPSDPIVAAIFEGIRRRGAEPLNMHKTLAYSPKVFKAYVDLAYALRASAKVPRIYRELIILRTAQLSHGDYELAQHGPMALSCGISKTQLGEIEQWKTSSLFDAKQRSVLAYADAMARFDGVDDATYEALSQNFDAQEIVELTLTAAFYEGVSRTTRTLRIPIEESTRDQKTQYGNC